jgi:hypothetical protein
VENGLAFESWRPVWAQYGVVISDVARAAFPEKSNEELRAHIIEASAAALVDQATFDPLESLITQVLGHATRESRSRAVIAMQQHRISDARIEAMLGVTGLPPAQEGLAFREPDSELFDDICIRAGDLQRRTPLLSEPPVSVAASGSVIAVDLAGAPVGSRAVARRNKYVPILAAAALLLGSGALSARILWREKSSSPALLYAERYSTEWEVSEANSFTPGRVRTPPTLVQTFTSVDEKENASLTVADYRNRSAEPEFAQSGTEDSGAPKRADAVVSSLLANGPNEKSQSISIWQEGPYRVLLRSSSTNVDWVKRMVKSLKPTDDLILRGYRTPEGFKEGLRALPAETSNDVSASVTFRNEDRKLSVTINVVRNASRHYIEMQEVSGDFSGEGRSFGRGRTFRPYRTFGYGVVGLFVEGTYTYFVAASRDNDNAEPGNRQGQRDYFHGRFGSGELSDADELELFLLLGHVRAGNADEWRSLTAGLQSQMLQIPETRSLRFGSLDVTLRQEKKDFIGGHTYMCTKNSCSSLYNIENTQAADLLIDGHWWHFEELLFDGKIPTWTTSPKMKAPFTAADNAQDRTRWYAIDLGPDTRLARSRKDGEILGRPIVG